MIDPVINYFNSIFPMPQELVDDLKELTIAREYKTENDKTDFHVSSFAVARATLRNS